jgi:DNA-binding HxlR family transcriptional regulator
MMVAVNGDMSMSEIQKEFPETMKRTVIRRVKDLHEKQKRLDRDIVSGKGKHKRYFINEENSKNDLLLRTVQMKGRNYQQIRSPITQSNLSNLITQEIKFYNKESHSLMKKQNFNEYVFYHIALMAHCLESISQITWAMHSGMFGNSKNKLELANRNRERYEEFLQKIIYNLSEKNNEIMKAVSKAMYYVLMDTQLFIKITVGKAKNKPWLRINDMPKVNIN